MRTVWRLLQVALLGLLAAGLLVDEPKVEIPNSHETFRSTVLPDGRLGLAVVDFDQLWVFLIGKDGKMEASWTQPVDHNSHADLGLLSQGSFVVTYLTREGGLEAVLLGPMLKEQKKITVWRPWKVGVRAAQIAVLKQGFAVVWITGPPFGLLHTGNSGVLMRHQIFDEEGRTVSEMQVISDSLFSGSASVSVEAVGGGYVVVWQEEGGTGSEFDGMYAVISKDSSMVGVGRFQRKPWFPLRVLSHPDGFAVTQKNGNFVRVYSPTGKQLWSGQLPLLREQPPQKTIVLDNGCVAAIYKTGDIHFACRGGTLSGYLEAALGMSDALPVAGGFVLASASGVQAFTTGYIRKDVIMIEVNYPSFLFPYVPGRIGMIRCPDRVSACSLTILSVPEDLERDISSTLRPALPALDTSFGSAVLKGCGSKCDVEEHAVPMTFCTQLPDSLACSGPRYAMLSGYPNQHVTVSLFADAFCRESRGVLSLKCGVCKEGLRLSCLEREYPEPSHQIEVFSASDCQGDGAGRVVPASAMVRDDCHKVGSWGVKTVVDPASGCSQPTPSAALEVTVFPGGECGQGTSVSVVLSPDGVCRTSGGLAFRWIPEEELGPAGYCNIWSFTRTKTQFMRHPSDDGTCSGPREGSSVPKSPFESPCMGNYTCTSRCCQREVQSTRNIFDRAGRCVTNAARIFQVACDPSSNSLVYVDEGFDNPTCSGGSGHFTVHEEKVDHCFEALSGDRSIMYPPSYIEVRCAAYEALSHLFPEVFLSYNEFYKKYLSNDLPRNIPPVVGLVDNGTAAPMVSTRETEVKPTVSESPFHSRPVFIAIICASTVVVSMALLVAVLRWGRNSKKVATLQQTPAFKQVS